MISEWTPRFNKARMRCLSASILIMTASLSAHAASSSDINAINQSIASVKQDLQKSTQQKSQLQNALVQSETTENQLDHSLAQVQQQLSQKKVELQTLKAQSTPLKMARDQNREALRNALKGAYVLKQQPPIKVLLSDDGFEKAQRTMMYYHYFTQSQLAAIKNLEKSIQDYQQNQAAIQKQNVQLSALKIQQLQNEEKLKKTRVQRLALIQTINQDIQSKNQRLQQLLKNKTQLQKTLASLNATPFEPTQVFSKKPFNTQRGKLPWPVIGHIIRSYGTPIEESELKWDGDIISASQGTPVRAIANGKVIFAKWLSGYGLLIILNHGNGYMTLYGRNNTITKQVGETVQAGDTIATVGNSGGFPNPGLYFSIRQNGRALNPAHWCK